MRSIPFVIDFATVETQTGSSWIAWLLVTLAVVGADLPPIRSWGIILKSKSSHPNPHQFVENSLVVPWLVVCGVGPVGW